MHPHRLPLDGDLTIYRATELREALLAALQVHPELDLDLAAVTEIDSAGIQLLLAAQRTAAAAGGRLRVQARSGAVDETFATLGLAARFPAPAAPEAASHP